MASVKFGGGIVAMSGSIAGNVFSHNRSGAYVRARTTPTNPNTARQQAVRNSIAFLATEWSEQLSAAQRTAWNLYAASVAMTNRLGESVFLTGFNHYVRSNSLLKRNASALIAAGPTTFELPAHDPTLAFAASSASQVITVTYDDTMTWCDEDSAFMHIFQGSPQNAQRNFFDGPWRQLGRITGNTGSPPTSPATFPASFAVADGQRDWLYARIQRDDGRLSEPFRADAFVGA